MKLFIKNGDENIELNGTIRSIKNKYYVEIEVPHKIILNDFIYNIKGDYYPKGKITLLYNTRSSIRGSTIDDNINIQVYEVSNVVTGYIDETQLNVSALSVYFKEFDSYFIKDTLKVAPPNSKDELKITQKRKKIKLLENEEFMIVYNRNAWVEKDIYGNTVIHKPASINLIYSAPIEFGQVFQEIEKLERVFSFVLKRKMNLIQTLLFVNGENEYHELIIPSQKEFNEVNYEESSIVDVSSNKLLKDVLKEYYNNEFVEGAINTFYEYICNSLNNYFEFASIVNTIEFILGDDKYNSKLISYNKRNNKKLQENNAEIRRIQKKLGDKEKKFIKSFYNDEFVELRSKLKYIFFRVFGLEEKKGLDEYFSKIVNTRNYFVHGVKKVKILGKVDAVVTRALLENMLYILIMDICTKETNINTDKSRLMISMNYEIILKSRID